jgi:hypothetical protein
MPKQSMLDKYHHLTIIEPEVSFKWTIACYLQNKIIVGKKIWILSRQLYAYEYIIEVSIESTTKLQPCHSISFENRNS